MNKRIYPSWLIGVGSLALVLGAFSALFLDPAVGSWPMWALVSACLTVIAFVWQTRLSLLIIVCAGFGFGLWRASNVLIETQAFEHYINQTVTLRGRIAEDTGIASNGNMQLRLTDVILNDQSMTGVVWVTFEQSYDVRRSDIVVVEGRLGHGFGTIPATLYRAQLLWVERVDYADIGRDVRDTFAGGIRTAIQEPEASLASGFLVGQKTALPEKLDNELRLLGLTHIVVASGYNLTILVRFARRWLSRVSRFTALSGGGMLVASFMAITGASPSMARASLVTGLSLITWYYGRKIHPFVLLACTAGVTVALNPTYAWGDIGWLLSFASFIGVIILAPLLHAFFWGDQEPGMIRRTVFETMSAQIVTLPIIAYIFGQYSPLSLLANLLILPLIPFTMVLIFVGGVVGIVLAPAAMIAGFPAEVLLVYMTSVVDYLAALPLAEKELNFSLTALVTCYIAISWIVVFLYRKSGYRFRDYSLVE